MNGRRLVEILAVSFSTVKSLNTYLFMITGSYDWNATFIRVFVRGTGHAETELNCSLLKGNGYGKDFFVKFVLFGCVVR